MQTPNRSGIICDYCGITNTSDFQYYSFDFHGINVTNNRIPGLDMLHHASITSSYDICTACYAHISQTIVENYKKTMSAPNAAHRHVCEITGKQLTGTYNYYYCVLTKVDVRITGQPNICVTCQKKSFGAETACQCGSVNFMRPALINTITRFLEFNICEEAFQVFRQKAETIRTRPAQWTTDS
jgi:hypothetical protein